MDKNEVFKLAILDYDSSFKELAKTTFPVIEKIIRGINFSELSEEEKKDKLGKILSNIKGSHENKIMGVKREELTIITDKLFKLKNNKVSNVYLQKLDMNEILYYFCSISRMVVSSMEFPIENVKKISEEVEKILNAEEERLRKTEKEKAEALKKAEEEKKAAEDAAKKEEEKRLASMSEVDRKIDQLKDENGYVDLFNSLDKFNSEDKIKAAKVLKEYWSKEKDKWEGKLSKKQKPKVQKVKEILG